FAYTQAPREMKGIVQSLWLLTSTLANVAVAIAAALNVFSGPGQFFFYGGLALLAAGAMAFMARHYQVHDYYQQDVGGSVPDRAQPPPALADSSKAL
ncbi:MAG TPA: MFS transporter, partial [Archangium sp.]